MCYRKHVIGVIWKIRRTLRVKGKSKASGRMKVVYYTRVCTFRRWWVDQTSDAGVWRCDDDGKRSAFEGGGRHIGKTNCRNCCWQPLDVSKSARTHKALLQLTTSTSSSYVCSLFASVPEKNNAPSFAARVNTFWSNQRKTRRRHYTTFDWKFFLAKLLHLMHALRSVFTFAYCDLGVDCTRKRLFEISHVQFHFGRRSCAMRCVC